MTQQAFMPVSRRRNDIGTVVRFLGTLSAYLGHPGSPDDCRRRILAQFRDREASTLRLFRLAVFSDESSPYLRLLRHAGVTYADVAELLRTEGVEGALGKLHDAGVHLTLDEFKGKRAIQRGSLRIPVDATDFDNRTLTRVPGRWPDAAIVEPPHCSKRTTRRPSAFAAPPGPNDSTSAARSSVSGANRTRPPGLL